MGKLLIKNFGKNSFIVQVTKLMITRTFKLRLFNLNFALVKAFNSIILF